MYTTSVTLLEALRKADDQGAWLRFVKLYTPLLYHWARHIGLQQTDAEDLVQDIFVLLLRKLPEFHYRRDGSFRSWLRVVALNKWRERGRRPTPLAAPAEQLNAVPAADETAAFEQAQYCQHVVGSALRLIEPEFSPTAWKAFQEHVIGGRDAALVAQELGIRPGTVYAAKSRVMTRLRRELDGLID